MRSSQKSGRGRGKNNRNKGQAHSPNRVYESAGPEGKVRGTPQQIIDKYQALARDAQLSGDRVAAENFLQHAEHYARILVEAQEANARREAQHQQNQPNQHNQNHQQNQPAQGGGDRQPRADAPVAVIGDDDQPPSDGLGALGAAQGGAPEIVDTPEANAPKAPQRQRRPRPRRDAPAEEAPAETAEAPAAAEPDAAAG